nr:hypothetical protein [Halolamina sp. CBA1230]
MRIDIPDETDPDHDRYHGREGVIEEIRTDDAAKETGRAIDSIEYLVELDDGAGKTEEMWFRGRDVRPR